MIKVSGWISFDPPIVIAGKIYFGRSQVRDVALKRLSQIDDYCKVVFLSLPIPLNKEDEQFKCFITIEKIYQGEEVLIRYFKLGSFVYVYLITRLLQKIHLILPYILKLRNQRFEGHTIDGSLSACMLLNPELRV